jgi:hypothetical protein
MVQQYIKLLNNIFNKIKIEFKTNKEKEEFDLYK